MAFARDVQQSQSSTTVKANPEWLQVYEEAVPSMDNLNQALARTAPGAPKITKQTATSDRISTPRTSIALLKIITPLLHPPFLSPTSACHIML